MQYVRPHLLTNSFGLCRIVQVPVLSWVRDFVSRAGCVSSNHCPRGEVVGGLIRGSISRVRRGLRSEQSLPAHAAPILCVGRQPRRLAGDGRLALPVGAAASTGCPRHCRLTGGGLRLAYVREEYRRGGYDACTLGRVPMPVAALRDRASRKITGARACGRHTFAHPGWLVGV
eukprot:5422339-Pleurochrysis_carterae.AAC.1